MEYFSIKEGVLIDEFIIVKDYLKNEFDIGNRNISIPYEFWTGNMKNNSL